MLRLALFLIGTTLLAQAPVGVAASAGNANLPAQRIGPNDLIAVTVYDAPELTRTVRVTSDGQIRLPLLDEPIMAQGLLPADLQGKIATALETGEVLVDPVVTVTVVEYHSRPISVAGAVNRPLTFQAETPVTLLDSITRAGGLAPEAGPEILVSRSQAGLDGEPVALVQRISVADLLESAAPEWNITLYGGEEVRVPEAGRIYVVGNVNKPGSYPVDEASGTSVLKILALTEGLAPYARKQAYIYRQEPGSREKHEIEIALRQIMDRRSPDVLLQPNDILYVPDNRGKRAKMSALEKIIGFGTATASGVVIWGVAR